MSLKVHFDRAVIGVMPNAPARVISEEYGQEDQRAVLIAQKKDSGSYSVTIKTDEMIKSALGGICKKFKGLDEKPLGDDAYDLQDLPSLFRAWQQEMEAKGWYKTGVTILGKGADYRALEPAHKP